MTYPKEVVLKNKKMAVIRPFQVEDDPQLQQFYASFTSWERWFIPYEMMRSELQCRWSAEIGVDCLFSVVAFCEDQLVAHANLHVRGNGHCTGHVGRLLVKVLPAFRQQRLGTWMLLDLIKLAMEKGLRDLRVDLVVGVDDEAIEALRKLDFYQQAILSDYAMDPEGRRYDMVIMTKRLHKDYGDF